MVKFSTTNTIDLLKNITVSCHDIKAQMNQMRFLFREAGTQKSALKAQTNSHLG